jgi:hypothetical protein
MKPPWIVLAMWFAGYGTLLVCVSLNLPADRTLAVTLNAALALGCSLAAVKS